MSLRGQRRSRSNTGRKNETGSHRLTEFNTDNESDPNIKYTSTPLKKSNVSRLQELLSSANFNSEESTDAPKVQTRPLKRRKTSRSLKKERMPSARVIGSAELREKRRRRSSRRASDGNKNDREGGAGEIDDFERLGKERTTHRQAEGRAELPIAELLRRAQENQKSEQTRYEDPIPLPELTTDTLYVQGRNGFSAVKIGNFRNERSSLDRLLKPIHIAIKIHNFSKTVMLFCQGLLGGIALSQVILVTKLQADSNLLNRINLTGYPHLMSGLLLFLVTMSLLAAMDRIDIAHPDLDHFRGIFSHRCIMLIACPLYLVAMCIHLSAVSSDIDQRLTTTLGQEPERSDATDDEEQAADRQTHTWKFVLCIIAWFFIALGPSDDLTTAHLEAMQKYAD